ncbi:MAG TPA: MFS transporter [Candidatus Nanopelagicaceae bacterium]|nr:MFS transporter [Candidatus Nanopelagicaceae bacterium]
MVSPGASVSLSRADNGGRLTPYLFWGLGAAAYIDAVTNRTSFGVAAIEAAHRFNIGPTVLSLFTALQLLVYALAQLPVGLAIDHFGPRAMIAGGAFLMALGQLLLATSHSPVPAILGRAVVGLGDAMSFISVLRLTTSWFPANRVPIMTQITGLLGWFGQLLSAIPFAALLHLRGWSIAFNSLAILSFASATITLLFLKESPIKGAHRSWPTKKSVSANLHAVWRNPAMRLGFWSHWTTPFATSAFALLWGVPFLVKAEGYSKYAASSFLTIIVVVGALGGFTLAILTSRYPEHLTKMTYTITASQVTAWTATLCWPGRIPTALIVVLVVALAVGGPGSLIGFAHARLWIPVERIGTADGFINAAGFIAALIAMFGIGIILQWRGSYSITSFKLAFMVQFPIWAIGVFQIARYNRKLVSVHGKTPDRR